MLLIDGLDLPTKDRMTIQIGSDGAVYIADKCRIISEKYLKDVKVYTNMTDKGFIHVGDEVRIRNEDIKGVVLDETDNDHFYVLTENACVEKFDKRSLKKTGKHYDELGHLIKELRK